jgi:hypothetical protein
VLDLAGDGRRPLVVPRTCAAHTEVNVHVHEGSAGGYRALDVITSDGPSPIRGWEFADQTLTLTFDAGTPSIPYRWDGSRFVK